MLHNQLQTNPVSAKGPVVPSEPHHLQKQQCNPQPTELQTPRTLTHTRARLHLEIPSMKITNRIGDMAQPWGRPTHNGNKSDFLLRNQTQLSLWACRDLMALSSEPLSPYSCSTSYNISRETLYRSTRHMQTDWANFSGSFEVPCISEKLVG